MRQLGVFAKHWQPGEVKTRLAATLGPHRAADIHRSFLVSLLDRLADVAERRVLAFSPPDRREAFESLATGAWQIQPQTGGDLGARMADYFQRALAAGAKRVVLVGSDSPTLPVSYVQHALDRLRDVPVVLGPTSDGGYYLVGAAGEVPPIFDGVSWSTGAVWEQTVDRLTAAGCPFARLPEWWDVDDGDDLARLRRQLADPSVDTAEFAELRRSIEEIVAGV